MTQPPPPDDPPGDIPADEPGRQDFPEWPMTAKDASALLPKDIA